MSYRCDYSDEYLQRVFGVMEENCEACREDWRNIGKNQILLRNEIMEKQGLFDNSMTEESENLETSQVQIGGIEEFPMNLDLTDDDISVKDVACNEPFPTVIPSASSPELPTMEAITLVNQSVLSISDSDLEEAKGESVIHSLKSGSEKDEVPSCTSSVAGESDDTQSADIEEMERPMSASSPRKNLNILVTQEPQANVRVEVENENAKPNIIVKFDNQAIEDQLELGTGPAESPVEVELSRSETQIKSITTVLMDDKVVKTKKKLTSVVETVTKKLTTSNKVAPSDALGGALSDVRDESLEEAETVKKNPKGKQKKKEKKSKSSSTRARNYVMEKLQNFGSPMSVPVLNTKLLRMKSASQRSRPELPEECFLGEAILVDHSKEEDKEEESFCIDDPRSQGEDWRHRLRNMGSSHLE